MITLYYAICLHASDNGILNEIIHDKSISMWKLINFLLFMGSKWF